MSERRDPESRGVGEAWWESTVHWLEVQAGTVVLKQCYKTFYSPEERSAHLKERVDAGVLYDIIWTTESVLGGKGRPDVPTFSNEEWELMVNGTVVSYPVHSNEPQIRE